MNFTLKPGLLSFNDITMLLNEKLTLTLSPETEAQIIRAQDMIEAIVAKGKLVYGVNTGFGALAKHRIEGKDLTSLQHKIILSHAAGVGDLLNDQIVRLIMLLRINSLARGYSGVRLATVQALVKLFNAEIYPCIPCQGSVGASGDLAPLAHLSAVLLGEGEARYHGKIISGKAALEKVDLQPLILSPKEGLALLNGTQASTAIALYYLIQAEAIFSAALIAGAMSIDAARASDVPLDEKIHLVRGHKPQIAVAEILRTLLGESEIRHSHRACHKVQDPYSLRCQPQVMGACLSQLNYAKEILLIEANAVSDNPIIFVEEHEVLSGGNFHAEPVAFAADSIALALAEIGALSERRIAVLIDPHFSDLPPFLVENAGLNSGFMMAQVTAAALASENKSLAHPASVDSIPTSANQEDHVSMATFAARRLGQMCENTAAIVGIELLAACQGIDLLRPLKTSAPLEKVYQQIRDIVPTYTEDRFFAPDIKALKELVITGRI